MKNNIDYERIISDWGEKILQKCHDLIEKETKLEVNSGEWISCRANGNGLRMAFAILSRMKDKKIYNLSK